MSEKPSFSPERVEVSAVERIAQLVVGMSANIGRYLREPSAKARALKLAAILIALSHGCAERPTGQDIEKAPQKIESVAPKAEKIPATTTMSQEKETSPSIEESLQRETGVSATNLTESIRAKTKFEGNIILKQVNYLKDEGYLGVSLAAEGDPAKQEMSQAGAFVVFKIKENNSVEILHILSEFDENGQPIPPPRPTDVSEERWQAMLNIDYTLEGRIITI